MSHEEKNRDRSSLRLKWAKKRSWRLLAAFWLQFSCFKGSKGWQRYWQDSRRWRSK
ncbi:Hypothetical protein FKW44_002125 [Caligus rogercresseyi]|uniref:Uncharacterized protein n=1 Tax=Caligus rogercresseyi TaxID=217165 RepID=A0A7T8KJP5_CALRO|nr:Hypothetical protein FKW44_002125 [Caligus rogercresseyi]